MTNKELAKRIRKAAARISKPGAWCVGALARDVEGAAVGYNSKQARSWCMWGTLDREIAGRYTDLIGFVDAVAKTVFGFSDSVEVDQFNDSGTQSEVVTALCFAAAVIESGDADQEGA